MVFSATCNVVLIRQLCASSIVFWFCNFVVTVPMLHLCCYFMETSLSSSMMMGKLSLPLSSHSLLHSSFVMLAIVRSIVDFLLLIGL